MSRIAAVALPFTLFLAWCTYVVTRAGDGPGLKWERVSNNVSYAATITGVAYLLFVLAVCVVLYLQRARGTSVSASAVIMPVLIQLAVVFVVSVIAGSALGEVYVLADERAFRRETAEFMKTAAPPDPKTGYMQLYSRNRRWPAGANSMVSPDSASK